LLLYAHTITPRLEYITAWIQEHFIDAPIELTDSTHRYSSYVGPRLNYSAQRISEQECWIEPNALLFEEDVRSLQVSVSDNGTFPILFCARGDMGFDVLAASFYLLSRYEEYLPGNPDIYGRFDHTRSMAFQHHFLHRPLIDEWMMVLMRRLQSIYPDLMGKSARFEWLPTYDIDESFAYLHKPLWKQLAGCCRDLLMGRMGWVRERIRTHFGAQKDPYDSFDQIRRLHEPVGIKPVFFFHAGQQVKKYDKALSPEHPAQQQLIRSVSTWAEIALHPSWESGEDPALLHIEKESLERVIGHPVHCSRQHYIRFQLPNTFRQLIQAGITDDYSMGYGSVNGFRASTARSHYWFDLENNKSTGLRLHPFCFMEANSFFEAGHRIDAAEKEWRALEDSIRSVNGRMITIWHNTSLGTQARFAQWGERYMEWARTLKR
jgi:hypothetical protein